MGAQLTIERVSGERSVLDHDLIALPLHRCARHDVTEGREDAVAAPLYLLNLMLEGDRKAELVGSLLPDHPLGVGQLLGELRVDRDERDMAALARAELGDLWRGMPAGAVVDDDLGAERDISCERIPYRGAMLRPRDPIDVWRPPVATITRSGLSAMTSSAST